MGLSECRIANKDFRMSKDLTVHSTFGNRHSVIEDGLHLSKAGYDLWTDILKPYLEKKDPMK